MPPLKPRPSRASTFAYTALAMIAFAGNSVLCRLALGSGSIDAASFTTLRLASGALALGVLVAVLERGVPSLGGSWSSALVLVTYAVPFSFAYRLLDTSTGALILFGAVQLSMVTAGLLGGERPLPLQWGGLVAAVVGLVVLLLPGLSAPSPLGGALMAIAGVAWGVYSLRGRGGSDPLGATAGAFCKAAPLAVLVSIALHRQLHLEMRGAVLAIASGALASGLGYVIWYQALRGLTATRAAAVQLSVPVLAAFGGLVFVGEAISARLVAASVLVLGGIGLTVAGRARTLGGVRRGRTERGRLQQTGAKRGGGDAGHGV